MAEEVLLKVENVKKYFPIKGGVMQRTVGYVKAVDGVSFEIKKGETLGLVGESGCGKSTTGRTILNLLEKTEGKIYFQGKDIDELSKKDLRKMRPKMQLIFQCENLMSTFLNWKSIKINLLLFIVIKVIAVKL